MVEFVAQFFYLADSWFAVSSKTERVDFYCCGYCYCYFCLAYCLCAFC